MCAERGRMLQYSLPQQRESWLYGRLAFNVNNRLIFQVKNGGLNHNNGRSARATCIITPSATQDVMMVKLLVSAPLTEQSDEHFQRQVMHRQWHITDRNTHSHLHLSQTYIHMLGEENEIQRSLVWYNEKKNLLEWYQGARLVLLENKMEEWGEIYMMPFVVLGQRWIHSKSLKWCFHSWMIRHGLHLLSCVYWDDETTSSIILKDWPSDGEN